MALKMKENEQETPLSPSKAPDPQGQEHVYISSLFQMSGAHYWRLPKSELLFWLIIIIMLSTYIWNVYFGRTDLLC